MAPVSRVPLNKQTNKQTTTTKSFVSDTAKADVLVKHYASVSRHKFSRAEKKTDCVVRTRLTEDRRNPEPLGPESDDFSMEELVSSVKAGKASGAEGPAGLAPRFLKNLGEVSRSSAVRGEESQECSTP
jgi:hypothetical protein